MSPSVSAHDYIESMRPGVDRLMQSIEDSFTPEHRAKNKRDLEALIEGNWDRDAREAVEGKPA